MDNIPTDLKKLIELYLSFSIKDNQDLSVSSIINGLVYNNKILDEKTLKKLSKIKSITYDEEELKKLIISQNIKNYLIQELFKEFLKHTENKFNEISSSFDDEIIDKIQKSYDRQTKYFNHQKDFQDKVEHLISSFDNLKEKYNL